MPFPALAPVVPRIAASAGIARHLERPHPTLSFDDGPHPQGTPAVLDELDAAGVRAVFFLVGEQVERYPDLAAQVAARGHEIAVHGHHHRVQLRLSHAQIREDIANAISVIRSATGVEPHFHRPPLGVYSQGGLVLARELGLEPLLWSHWGKDWRRFTTPSRIASRATRGVGPGDVILLHDADHYSSRNSWERTVAALPAILRALQPTGSGSESTGVSAPSQS